MVQNYIVYIILYCLLAPMLGYELSMKSFHNYQLFHLPVILIQLLLHCTYVYNTLDKKNIQNSCSKVTDQKALAKR